VMTAPAHLPLIGQVKFTETTKEELLEFWEGVEQKTGVEINYHERLEEVVPNGAGFMVKTNLRAYKTRAILLAIGRRGTPRKLGVPGEQQEKVVYRLIDPEQYRGQHVLVVGGGDSALEAATSIAAEPDSKVILSYRSEAFGRAKAKNRTKVEEAQQAGRLMVLMKSNVKRVESGHVLIEQEGKLLKAKNDAVIVCAGGILPTGFLKSIGVEVETKYGTAGEPKCCAACAEAPWASRTSLKMAGSPVSSGILSNARYSTPPKPAPGPLSLNRLPQT